MRGKALAGRTGPLVVRTGKHTGRSPKDKFIVDEPSSDAKIWWGEVNQPITEEHYDRLRRRLIDHVAERDLFVQDCFDRRRTRITGAACASTPRPPGRASSRATSSAARRAEELAAFEPELHDHRRAHRSRPTPRRDGTRTETAILVHLARMEVLIVGTEYAGEIKKSAFTVMNYLLPDEGVLPMHSAVNVGEEGDVGRLLRPVGDGQDDALRRPGAEPHRRRRARLGTGRRLQLRGRLLRQDDPPLADLRARHLLDDASASGRSSRTSTSTRSRASSTSTPSGSPRTRAAPTRSSSSATRIRPAWPASRATSSS